MSDVRVSAQQREPGVTSDGNLVGWRGDRSGIAFVGDWKYALFLEGRCFQMTIGALADAAVTALIQAGGAGTITDLDQPEGIVSVPDLTALLPLNIDVSASADLDANDEIAELLVLADKSAAYADDGTVTAETPINLITSGGVTSVANAASAATGNITDPTCDMILAHELVREMAVTDTTAGVPVYLHLHYEPTIPVALMGPAAFYIFGGGTTRVDLAASVIWAEVPESRFTA